MSKITQYVRHLAVVAIATLLAQCAWAEEYTVAIPAEAETLALTSALSEYATVTASDTITIAAGNTASATFDFDANLTVGTLKITGDGEIVFTKSNDAAVTITDLDLQDRTAQVTFKNFVPSMTNVKPKNIAYNAATIGSYPYAIADGSQLTFDLADDTSISTVFCPSAMSSRVMRLTKKGAGVLTLNGQSYNKGIWTVEAGAIKQGNNHAGSGSQAWGGPFGRMSTGAYGTAGEGGAGMNQNVYVDVKDGAYVDLNGKENCYSYRIAGNGLGNGAIISSTSGLTDGKISALSIELAADASVGGDQNIGLITANFAGTTLNLGSYTLTKKGTGGFFIANATINGNGSFALEGGVLQLNTPSDKTLSNVISGSGTFKKTGNGNLTLSGKNNNMTGPITIAAGTLTVGNYDALGTYAANQTRAITVESGATLNNQNHDMTGRKLVISGTGSGSNGAAYITTGNGAMMREYRDGTIVLAADATIKIDNGRGIKTQYMEYVFGGHTLTKIGSADLTMRNNWTADTDSGRFVVAAGGIAFDTVGVRFGAIDMTVGENGTIKRNLANNTLAVKSLTLESGATISDSKTAISVSGALMVGETIKLPNATEGMVVMTVAGDKPTTLPSIVDSELALAFDGNDLKVVNATPAGVTITLPTVANTTITKVMSGESEVEVVEGAITVAPGTEVTITYTPDYGYLGGGDLTVTINSDTTTESISTESITTSAAVAVAAIGEQSYTPDYVGYSTLSDAIAAGWYVLVMDDVTVNSTIVIDHSVVIDLQGHNVTGNGVRVFQMKNGTVEIDSTDADSGDAIPATISTTGTINPDSSVIRIGGGDVSAAPKLTIGEGVTISSAVCYGISAFGVGTQTLVVDGTVATTGNRPAISGNGNASNGETTITINGTVSATAENAIYQPQAGTTSINGTVTGGIEAKAGAVTIKSGATVTARETTATHTANGDGCSTQGYAVAAVDNAGYKGGAVVTIEGGTITGPVAQVVDSEAKEANTLTITGGTFTVDPSAYVADGYEATESEGVWTVSEKTGPTSWDDVDKDTELSKVVSAETAAALADSGVKASDIATWATKNNVTFESGITIPVNALILNCAPTSDAMTAAENAVVVDEATMDAIMAAVAAGTDPTKVEIPAAVKAKYPMAKIKLIESTKIQSTETAKFFQLKLSLK